MNFLSHYIITESVEKIFLNIRTNAFAINTCITDTYPLFGVFPCPNDIRSPWPADFW